METAKIPNCILVIKIPEDKIKEDLEITEHLLWDRIPEQLVYGFFVRNFRHLRDLQYAHPREKRYIPTDWNTAKIGFERRVPDRLNGIEKSIDIVLQSGHTYYIVEVKSRKTTKALREAMRNARLFQKEHASGNTVQPVVVTSARNLYWLRCQSYAPP